MKPKPAFKYDKRKAECIALLGEVCVQCGTTDNLEFDHVDPSTKSFNISSKLTVSWDMLLPELRKCQLLCTPCHIAKTNEDRTSKSA